MSSSRFALSLLAGSALACVACVKGNPSPPSEGDVVLEGGTLLLADCGYSVTSRAGASAPVLATEKLDSDPTPKQVHLGLAGKATESIVISWRTGDETSESTIVQFGKASVSENELTGITFQYQLGFGNGGDTIRMHEAHVCGLEPDTLYKYRVGGRSGSSETWSPEYTFRTAPDLTKDPSASISVLILGDTRDGYDTWGKLLKKGLEVASPDLILFTGDAVTVGQLQEEWDAFFTAGEEVLRSVPMLAAHGNHDTNSINYFSQLAMPGDEANFSIDYGPLNVTVANDSPVEENDVQNVVPQFLDKALGAAKASGIPWRFVLHHKPAYSSAGNHGSDETIQQFWVPIFDKHAVDVVVSGHDHNYERSKPMAKYVPVSSYNDGRLYLVAGSAGVSLYDNGTSEFTAVSRKTMNMVVMTLASKTLQMTAYSDSGEIIDTVSITKP